MSIIKYFSLDWEKLIDLSIYFLLLRKYIEEVIGDKRFSHGCTDWDK